ncbi:MAG TPA: hypothetical protein VGN17_07190 [Bryobacteraceae bacterium]|jgi:hypothetical protein
MAGRGPQSFKKRQKEQQRKEKQQEKLARKVERRQSGTQGAPLDDEPFNPDDLSHLDRPIAGIYEETTESERG